MNGPEHYATADALLKIAGSYALPEGGGHIGTAAMEYAQALGTMAAAHAQLAFVALAADSCVPGDRLDARTAQTWEAVIGRG